MIIRKSRIRSLAPQLLGVKDGEDFTFGVRATLEVVATLPTLGFSDVWVDGESLLPPASIGPASRRNAEGWEIIHRDRPKETVTHPFEWHWTEWARAQSSPAVRHRVPAPESISANASDTTRARDFHCQHSTGSHGRAVA